MWAKKKGIFISKMEKPFLYCSHLSVAFLFKSMRMNGGQKSVLEIFIFPTRARDKGTNRVEILFFIASLLATSLLLLFISSLNMQRLYMLKAFSVPMTWECGQLVWCWWDGVGMKRVNSHSLPQWILWTRSADLVYTSEKSPFESSGLWANNGREISEYPRFYAWCVPVEYVRVVIVGQLNEICLLTKADWNEWIDKSRRKLNLKSASRLSVKRFH